MLIAAITAMIARSIPAWRPWFASAAPHPSARRQELNDGDRENDEVMTTATEAPYPISKARTSLTTSIDIERVASPGPPWVKGRRPDFVHLEAPIEA